MKWIGWLWGQLRKNFVNIKWIENAKAVTSDVHGNNFDVLCVLKRETDKEDMYWMYRLNNKQLNNGLPSFAFKSSLEWLDFASTWTEMAKPRLANTMHISTQRMTGR